MMNLSSQYSRKLVILDAMGVIYAEADDGPNLLYPFIVNKGGCSDVREVLRLYIAASLGKISSEEFWRSAGLNPALEDEYLEQHRLSDGLPEFLDAVASRGIELWCLSNDVSEWSRKLRERFALQRYFRGFVISGDVGAQKPDVSIYQMLLERAGYRPGESVFVDDRLRNIKAAASIGINPILFKPAPRELHGHSYPIARDFSELLKFL